MSTYFIIPPYLRLPTSVLEQLTKRLSDTVQILTAFLFHSLHSIALWTYDPNHVFATTKSSNCQFSIPIEGSYWIAFSLGNLINNASYNLVFIAIFMRSYRTEISMLYFNLPNLYELHY